MSAAGASKCGSALITGQAMRKVSAVMLRGIVADPLKQEVAY
jgi:hypothetical protein